MLETTSNNRDKTADTLILTKVWAKTLFESAKIKIKSSQIVIAKEYFWENYNWYFRLVESGAIKYVKVFQWELIVIKRNRSWLFFKKLGLVNSNLTAKGLILFEELKLLNPKPIKKRKPNTRRRETEKKETKRISEKDITRMLDLFMNWEDASLSQEERQTIEKICWWDVYSVVAEYMWTDNKKDFIYRLLS